MNLSNHSEPLQRRNYKDLRARLRRRGYNLFLEISFFDPIDSVPVIYTINSFNQFIFAVDKAIRAIKTGKVGNMPYDISESILMNYSEGMGEKGDFFCVYASRDQEGGYIYFAPLISGPFSPKPLVMDVNFAEQLLRRLTESLRNFS